MFQRSEKIIFYLSWVVALVAMLGSLFFSEILKLPPCTLCWYQRIFMYPLAIIIPIGVVKNDEHLPLYILPLSIIGLGISIYHNLLYYQLIPESLAPCSLGVSCTTKFFEWFGFITIPFLSMLAFALITGSMVAVLKVRAMRRNV